MKKRTTIFGYQYQNGVIIVNQDEEAVIKQIFKYYMQGQSLLKIAKKLNIGKIEYSPGVIGWNKARVMRIVENKKYLGDEIYPVLIDSETYEKIQELKASKNTQKQTDRKAEIFQINLPVICDSCGEEMRRRHDSRNKCQQRWTCLNCDCHNIIKISDEDLLHGITDCLNFIIANSSIIKGNNSDQAEPNTEAFRLECEITKTLDGFGFDKDALRKKMMECVSLKYKSIDSTSHITKKLKADFEQSSPLITFCADFCSQTVKSVRLSTNKEIGIILTNDQLVRKEKNDDSDINDTSSKSSTTYTGNH
jgi:transposase-like protein